MNISIQLRPDQFRESCGIFQDVHNGALMDIVNKFVVHGQQLSQSDIHRFLDQQDQLGRQPLDIACFLNYKNIALYLAVKIGKPDVYLYQDLNVDKEGRSYYHYIGFRGNYEVLVTMLNYERTCLKKVISDTLWAEKNRFKFKNLDIKHGSLVSTVYHDQETVRRHQDFNMRATNLFELYCNRIIEKYEAIFMIQDTHGRTPLHYTAMSKFTNCYRCLQAFLEVDID